MMFLRDDYLPDSQLAMSIQGENKPGWIETQHWNALAEEAGASKQLIHSYLERQLNAILPAAQNILTLTEFTAEEIDFLNKQVIPVIEQRTSFVRNCLS